MLELSWRARTALGAACVAVMLVIPTGEFAAQPRIATPPQTEPLSHLPGIAGDYFKLESTAVGRDFHIFVSLPQSYEENSEQLYPVVYVLDGDSLFPIIAPTHLFLTIDYELPEAVIVGIAYGSFDPAVNKRGYDFTVSVPDSDQTRGGAPEFHAFLEDELVPLVERRYRADSSRSVLFGQSRGGGMVLYSAFIHPDVFWGRIASNPTFDPGRELFFAAPAEASRNDLGLVVTSGSSDIPELRAATLEWFSAWDAADSLPWTLHTVTIKDGAHASFSPSSYRIGMLRLFGLNARQGAAAADTQFCRGCREPVNQKDVQERRRLIEELHAKTPRGRDLNALRDAVGDVRDKATVLKIAAEVLGSAPVDENGEVRVGRIGLAFDADGKLISMGTVENGVTILTEHYEKKD